MSSSPEVADTATSEKTTIIPMKTKMKRTYLIQNNNNNNQKLCVDDEESHISSSNNSTNNTNTDPSSQQHRMKDDENGPLFFSKSMGWIATIMVLSLVVSSSYNNSVVVKNQSSSSTSFNNSPLSSGRHRETQETNTQTKPKLKPKNPTRRLFFCGYEMKQNFKDFLKYTYGTRIMSDAFPNELGNPHEIPPGIMETVEDVTKFNVGPNDIMITYWNMYNCQVHPDSFPGKTVVFSGEAPYIEDPKGERVYYLGPNHDSPNSIMIPYVTMRIHAIWENNGGKGKQQRMHVFNHKSKIYNDETYFLLYAVSNCIQDRDEAFDKLAEIGPVHQGGECWGLKKDRSKVIENREYDRNEGSNNNQILYRKYRFALVMENSDRPGYISEKVLNAFLGGTIPIWYGTTNVFQIFNRNAFIFYDIHNPEAALNQVRYLENNRTAYKEMLYTQPILADGQRTIERFFSFTDDVGKGFLKKRIRSMMGEESTMYHSSLIQNQALFGFTNNHQGQGTQQMN